MSRFKSESRYRGRVVELVYTVVLKAAASAYGFESRRAHLGMWSSWFKTRPCHGRDFAGSSPVIPAPFLLARNSTLCDTYRYLTEAVLALPIEPA